MIGAKLSVTFALLAWLLGSVDWARMSELVSGMHWTPLVLAVVLLFATFIPVARRWHSITNALGGKLGFLDALRMIFLLVIINQVVPSNVGGDAYRIFATTRKGLDWKRATLAAVIDRLMALVALSIVAMLGILALLSFDGLDHFRLFAVAGTVAIAGGAIAGWLFFRSSLAQRLAERSELFAKLFAVADDLLARPVETLYLLALSAAVHCVTVMVMCIVAANIGLDVPVLPLLGVCAVGLLVARLPISHGGWGVREGIFVLVLTPFGVAREEALAASITYGLTELAAAALGGVVGLGLVAISDSDKIEREAAG